MLNAICNRSLPLQNTMLCHSPNLVTDLVKKMFQAPAGYFLKICVFRSAALKGCFSGWIIEPLALAIINLWQKIQGVPNQHAGFDPARLSKSETFLSEFAEVRTVRTQDGKELRWTLYRPERFQQWIAANGGIRLGEWVVPREPGSWERLKRLGEFKWFEQRGQAFRIPVPVAGAQNTCVLRCQGFGRTMAMDKAFIGQHLASGFHYALFDWREEVSIDGYFADAEAAYQAVRREGFSVSQIKVMASCRGTFPAVRLKELHHAEGLDAVLIAPPPSLRAVIAEQIAPAACIGQVGLGAIEEGENHFDSIRRLRGLPQANARLCLIMSEGDRTLPEDTTEQFRQVANPAGAFEVIVDPRTLDGGDPHFEEPLRKPDIYRRYTEFLVR